MIILNPKLPFTAPPAIKEVMEQWLWPLFYHTGIYTSVEFILLVAGALVIFAATFLLALALDARRSRRDEESLRMRFSSCRSSVTPAE